MYEQLLVPCGPKTDLVICVGLYDLYFNLQHFYFISEGSLMYEHLLVPYGTKIDLVIFVGLAELYFKLC